MTVKVQDEIYDELSVLWTRGKNKGGDEKRENTKSVGQMTNKREERVIRQGARANVAK
jgi:hypothetical protein